MNLDWQTCSQARLSRDARFDGKFFIGVLTSGVYCRPICPARTAKESNVRYFPTAAAAAEAGFRPCLRCRPECSPGTPAWCGTSNTVSRALRLISESAIEDEGVDGLADRLGIGARHLRRLFLRHLGASPIVVANTRRLHFAKKLIDETRLPMGEIALAAGFGSVRRFNSALRKVYQRTPSELRALARRTDVQSENQYLFRLRFRPPYNWSGILAFLAPRATPGIEVVESGYRRTITLLRDTGYFEVRFEDPQTLAAHICFPDPRALFQIIERIRSMFDLSADWQAIAGQLRSDPELAARVDANPGLRVPGCWDGFELAVRAILGQQVTVKGATTLAGRLVQRFGKSTSAAPGLTHLFPSPKALSEAALENIGLPKTRAQTIRSLARAVVTGQIRFGAVLDGDAFERKLCEIPGIGSWTAQYIAMRALGEPDAMPTGDLGLLRALALDHPQDLEVRSKSWRPWRAYAAMYLWSAPAPTERQKDPDSIAAERPPASATRNRGPAQDEHALTAS